MAQKIVETSQLPSKGEVMKAGTMEEGRSEWHFRGQIKDGMSAYLWKGRGSKRSPR